MEIRTNPELADILNSCSTQYQQVRALDTALTPSKRIKAKRVANASTAQADVWATGTLFRDAALIGAFTFDGAEITSYGITSDLTTCLAADLATGKSVLRIEGGGHWMEFLLGLDGSGAGATFPENPTPTNSIAIAPTFRIRANQALPDGSPDTEAPTVSLAVDKTNVSSAGPLTLTATVSDNVAVTRVEFMRDGALLGAVTSSPWQYVEQIAADKYGQYQYTARAFDAAGNNTSSSAQTVSVDIIETGPATPVGSDLTTITMQSTDSATQNNVPVTFGQVFMIGALPATDAAVELRAPDSSIVPCQIDVKALHQDGSVRHAIISAILPSMAASESKTYSIRRRASPIAGTAPVPSEFSAMSLVAALIDTGIEVSGPTAGTTYTVDVSALLAAGSYTTWLSGPIVSEWIVRAPIKTSGGTENPDLHFRFNIRAYKGQAKAKIDYIVENGWAKQKSAPSGSTPWETVSCTDKIYKATVQAGGATLYTREENGYHLAPLNGYANIFNATPTGLPNDSTVYTATITIDGVAKALSVTGSAAQTFSQLKSVIDSQLAGAGTCILDSTNKCLRFVSSSTGAGSSVVISPGGSLLTALNYTGGYRPVRGDEFIHYARARWKRSSWWGEAPKLHVEHNKRYLMATKAVPNYAAGLTGSSTTIANNVATMNANGGIGQNGMTKAYMADVGYAPGIGILPEWAAMYLVSPSPDAMSVMLRQADCGASWPMYVRDYATDGPISFNSWPYAALYSPASDTLNPVTGLQELLPGTAQPVVFPRNANIPDISHHPDFFYIPYLVTGDHFYMESLAMHQRWLGLASNPGSAYRDGKKCLWKADQTRGQAWMMRTAAHARYILPDNHFAKSEIAFEIEQNLEWYRLNYLVDGAPYKTEFGYIWHGFSGIPHTMSGAANTGLPAWMDDFFTADTGRALELGFKQFRPLFDYKAKFQVGRLTNSALCWQAAALYDHRVRATSSSPLYTTWDQIYANSVTPETYAAACGSQAMADALAAFLPGTPATLNVMANRPSDIAGYPANLQPAVAYCASFDANNGDNAWLVFDSRSVKPDYNLGPQFAIVPRN